MNHQTPTEFAHCTRWRKASYSEGDSNCIEITTEITGWMGIRDSKVGDGGPVLAVPATAFAALLAEVGRQ